MSTQNLEKSFKTKDVFAMAFGTMIGWGWIMLSGQWAASAGMLGAILAYLGVAAWEGPAFSTALNYVVPIPKIGKLWTIQESDVYVSISLVAIIASIIIT